MNDLILDKNEGVEEEGDENEVSDDMQCLLTKTNEFKFTKPNKFLFVPVSLRWKEKKY